MSEDRQTRRRGKIAQCPRLVRERICQMLDDGAQAPEILAWANAQPEVQKLVEEKFAGEPISDNNLSQWFKGGFQEWREEQIRVEETAAKAELSIRLAKAAGGSISEGVVAVAAGKIMTALEEADSEQLIKLAAGAAILRNTEQTAEKIGIARERLAQRGEVIALERAKFERLAVKKFIDWAADQEAIAKATGPETEAVKMDWLMERMFGTRPETPESE